MDNLKPSDAAVLSVESMVDLIRTKRNDLLKIFLNDQQLSVYYQEQFSKEISNVKREFLKRDLKELSNSPVDLVHYSKVINHMKETADSSLTEKFDYLFQEEIQSIFKKYVF